ncbi:hypothetical protein [Candidatus Solirubrobacter pratensis]|uniref:hypothetical protein n=1 Tax=Candidatus Solirubrobacter pratensis TaxID=1298857 RepID=UPI000411FD06|nr:hypothetical protein [Candidatus Solirubrobacter pratensis]
MRRTLTLTAAAGLLALAAPAAASAATAPPPPNAAPVLMSFTPPAVGPLSVDIGATIINGQVVSQPLHVLVPATKIETSTWTWPSSPASSPSEP